MWSSVSAFDPSSLRSCGHPLWGRSRFMSSWLEINRAYVCDGDGNRRTWRKPTLTRGRTQKTPAWVDMFPLIAIIFVCSCKTAQVMKTYCGQDAMSRETLDGSGAPVLDRGPAWDQSAVTELLWGGPKLLACYQAPVAVVSFQYGAGSTQQPFTCVNCFLNVTPSKHRRGLSNNDI